MKRYNYYPVECPNADVPNIHRTFKMGNLFWRFIAFTPLAQLGWTGHGVGKLFDEKKWITIVQVRPISEDGRVWLPPEPRYFENQHFPSKIEFNRAVKDGLLTGRKPS